MIKLSLCAAAAVACMIAAPANAASSVTGLFMANVKANIAFLDQSGKLAATHSSSAKVQRFAKAEIADSFRTADMLDGVAPATRVADASLDTDVVLTGRSAATVPSLGQSANGRSALGQDDVADLAKLRGKSFDDALWLKQIDALSQLRADYTTYAASGDDAVLVALSKRELPKIETQLLALSKI